MSNNLDGTDGSHPALGDRPNGWLRSLPGLLPGLIVAGAVVWLVVAAPRLLQRSAANDLRGIPEVSALATVDQLRETPGNPGGGGMFNAVILTFDKHKAYYDLPPNSVWRPYLGAKARIQYRVGHSGTIKIDSVVPD